MLKQIFLIVGFGCSWSLAGMAEYAVSIREDLGKRGTVEYAIVEALVRLYSTQSSQFTGVTLQYPSAALGDFMRSKVPFTDQYQELALCHSAGSKSHYSINKSEALKGKTQFNFAELLSLIALGAKNTASSVALEADSLVPLNSLTASFDASRRKLIIAFPRK